MAKTYEARNKIYAVVFLNAKRARLAGADKSCLSICERPRFVHAHKGSNSSAFIAKTHAQFGRPIFCPCRTRAPLRARARVRRVNHNGKIAILGCRPPLGIAILHRKTHSQAYLPATSHIGATVQSSQILRGTRCAFRSTRKEGGRGQSTPSTPFDVVVVGGGGGHCLRKPSSNANRQKRSSGRRFPNSVLASSNATSDADDGGRLSAGERGERRPRTYAI